MSPRVSDILLDLAFGDAEELPALGAVPIEATVAGKVYALVIEEGDPLLDTLAPPCSVCGRACDGSCWDEFSGVDGDD